ncbi:MAG: hypothetical protein E5Y89_00500 [Mesorhizobium sp.]|nr:MAG: hypothetical protein E5Y89_00500 [Mesorhizobium sp.]
MIALAAKKIKPSDVTQDGSFLQYAPHEITRAMVERHPELCYDGKVWDEPYEALDYGDPAINEGTRASIRGKYASLINDAIYLARQDPSDLAASPREELVRAVMSLHLLRPDVET